ncbi:MAG: DUF4351 domain-containing protein [Peptococcaceae bacterium]|nr:DUF4351 domain-containing protein [Peptococcaceae bacterium]
MERYMQNKPKTILQLAKERAKKEGRRQGRRAGESQVLLRLLERKFGVVPADIRRRVQSASSEQLLEWAEVYGNYYGTPRRFVEEALARGEDVILEIDIQGALQVKKQFPEAVLIFIAPPSMPELRARLVSRGTDAREEIERRLGCASAEMKLADRYDYVVVNDEITRVLGVVRAIVTAEKSRPRYFAAFFEQFAR